MACGVLIGLVNAKLLIRFYLLFVHIDGENFFLLEFVWVTWISFDNLEPLVLVQLYFGGDEKNFGEEILLL